MASERYENEGTKTGRKMENDIRCFRLRKFHFYQLTIVHDDKMVTMGAYTIR